MEQPVARPVALHVLEGIAARHRQVARVELHAHDRRIGALDQDIVGHQAIDRSEITGVVVKSDPDAVGARAPPASFRRSAQCR